jgi:hypothetical protein
VRRDGESNIMAPLFVDLAYVAFCSVAGLWQAWCFTYGSDKLAVLLVIGMSLPFALATYAHGSLLSRAEAFAERPDWKRTLVLWVGMPLSLAVFSLTGLGETGIMYAFRFGIVELPFYNLRLLIAEVAACATWAACLLVWGRHSGRHPSRNRFLVTFAALVVGVLFANLLTFLALKTFHKDLYVYLESTFVTMISAVILVFSRRNAAAAAPGSNLGHGELRHVPIDPGSV